MPPLPDQDMRARPDYEQALEPPESAETCASESEPRWAWGDDPAVIAALGQKDPAG